MSISASSGTPRRRSTRHADRARARQYSSPLSGPGELAAAFDDAGFGAVDACALTIHQQYRNFADYWEPIEHAQGPVGDYVKGLEPQQLGRLAQAVRRAYLAGAADGPRAMAATAWAARGIVPDTT